MQVGSFGPVVFEVTDKKILPRTAGAAQTRATGRPMTESRGKAGANTSAPA